MKIKNEKVTAYMGKDFVADTMSGKYTYKAGTAFDAKSVRAGGVEMVEGHGISHGIPRDCFTKFVRTWKEVETNGESTMIVDRREDVTDVYLKWFADYDKIDEAAAARRERINLKHRIADLRAKIKFVKSGDAERELAANLMKLGCLF
jgi:hypothetical protein